MSGLEVTETSFRVVDQDWWGDKGSDQVRLAIMAWCERHRLDPMKIPATAPVIRDEQNRQVATTYFGEPQPAPDGDGMVPVREPYVVQLAAPPLPWPAEVWEAAG